MRTSRRPWRQATAGLGRSRSPAQDVRPSGLPEVPDVDALGPADPHPRRQRLVHVPEQGGPRAVGADAVQQGRGRRLRPSGSRRRRRARGRPAGCGCPTRRRWTAGGRPRRSPRRASRCGVHGPPRQGVRPGGSGTPPTNPNRSPPIVTTRPSTMSSPGRAYPAHSRGRSTLPGMAKVGAVSAAKSRSYCSRMACSTTAGASGTRAQAWPMNRRSSPGAPAGPEPPELGADGRPEHPAEDPRGGIVVVHELDQVAQHDQRVRAVAGPGQRLDVTVHVGHHVHPHGRSIYGADRRRALAPGGRYPGTFADRRRVQEGPTVREFSVPATVRVGDRESLVDAVYDTAAEHPRRSSTGAGASTAGPTSPPPGSPRR